MQLDSLTLLVAGCAFLVMLGGVFVLVWSRHRDSTELLWWGLPLVLGGFGLAAYMKPDWQSDYLAITLGNAARLFALGCLWQGVRVFQHRRPALLRLAAICLVWIGLCAVPAFVENMLARVIVASLITLWLAGLAIWELWRDRNEALASRWPTLLTFVSFALVNLVRVIIAPWAPFPMGAGPVNAWWLAIFLWVVFAHASLASMLFLAMTLERREAEQRGFALSDPLTGLMNRRAFADFAARMNRRRIGQRSALALLVLDLDHFKQVNDRFGHEAGDRMLKAFADVAERNVRPSDQLFRMGGEEFCFVLPDTTLGEAIAVAERIRAAFEATSIEAASGP
ncbi:MAG TPA: GGDEF domain-containing protein, partial [Hyphomicrobiaceae bacterium]|nr:GGDEF domain-containing protein [Hyphomicrobiaceae bacterium]